MLCWPAREPGGEGDEPQRALGPVGDRNEGVVRVAGARDPYAKEKGCCGYSLENKSSACQAEASYNLVGIHKLMNQVLEFN